MTVLPTIGMIELGEMGGPMARNLLGAGYPVASYWHELTHPIPHSATRQDK